MNKESVEIINRLRAILQDSWVNELPDNEKIAINFNKSELKLVSKYNDKIVIEADDVLWQWNIYYNLRSYDRLWKK